MTGERDLEVLLATMDPDLRAGRFVFTSVAGLADVPPECAPIAVVVEDEGVTLVLAQSDADRCGLAYDYVAAMITLRVHSSLDAVGLTAAVATRLAAVGISCNVIAGLHHDHLFVPAERGEDAVAALADVRGSDGISGLTPVRAVRRMKPTSAGAGAPPSCTPVPAL